MSSDGERTRIKFCGIRTPEAARLAVEAGADAVGAILAESPRRVDFAALAAIAEEVPAFTVLVAVMDGPTQSDVLSARALGAVPQFHGQELPEFCESVAFRRYLKAFHVLAGAAADAAQIDGFARDYPSATLLVDARTETLRGGTGQTYDWAPLRNARARRRIIVSGGLTPENVAACVRAVRPYGVDVRSGIETAGSPDPAKMRAFVRAVREADEQA